MATKELTVLPVYAPFYEDWRYKIALGGRSAGRSVAACQAAVYFGSMAKMRIVVLREFQNSIAESAKAQIEQIIEQLGVRSEWTFTLTNITHKRSGTMFMFYGLSRNYTKIKSLTDIDISIVEECETVSRESLDVLIPTIRKPGSEIWMMGNPTSRTSAVAQMFIENGTPDNCVVMRSTYLDNPFNSEELIAEAEHLRITDYKRYRHIYLGEYLDTSTMRMISNVVVEDAETVCSASDAVIVGVDIARSGGDLTVIWVRKGKKTISYNEYSDMEISRLTAELTGVIHRYKPIRINIDSTGTGQWVGDALKSTGITVCPVNFSEKAKKEERYSNRRTELYGLAQDYFEGGGTVPNDIKLIEELNATWYHLDTKNRMALNSKDDIKKAIGRSPDRADAFVLSLWNPGGGIFAKTTSDVVTALSNRKFTLDMLNAGSYGNKWK